MTRELKQSNLELEQRKRFVETLLANITAGVIAVDPTGRITTWNKTAEDVWSRGCGSARKKSGGGLSGWTASSHA